MFIDKRPFIFSISQKKMSKKLYDLPIKTFRLKMTFDVYLVANQL